ncbi:MAG: hypothetical protein HY908_23750 [Myxococcales bacterium]|nr:hypothetical protein [Myxococcales bacterium]
MRRPHWRMVAVGLVALGGCALAQCTDGAATGTGGTGGAGGGPGGADAGAGGAPALAGACGPIGPWGDWPPAAAPPRELVVLPPLFPRPDCGPGCRMVTTRNNTSNNRPWEMRFAGRLLTTGPDPLQGVIVNLDSGEEYALSAPDPEPGCKSLSAALDGDCLVQAFYFEEQGDAPNRGYVCETCLHRQATRGLYTVEAAYWSDAITANGNFALFGGGPLGTWALDLRDGSQHTFATSLWLVTNYSLNEPYIVLSEGDGEAHLIDTRDWSDTNVTNDPALQWMAASDGKTIVWIDQRFHAGGGLETPANQEVVAYDIASGVTTRLTYTDPAKASAKWDPAVEGDWVVWWDDRDSDAPNTMSDVVKNRIDIYGYNLATQKEYHVLGNQAGTLPESAHGPHGMLPTAPRLHDGKLYVVGLYTYQTHIKSEVWEFDLPTP